MLSSAPLPTIPLPVDAILFDLLTALLDSWSLWNAAAGSEVDGRRWRMRYLALTYAAGAYRPYEDVLQDSAREAGLPAIAAQTLVDTWDGMQPWPEVPALWTALPGTLRLGVVTNCSTALAGRAVRRLGHRMDVVVAAEQAGAYKPDARPYQRALEQLALPPSRVLFVAGSPADIPGASGVGMPVIWHNRLGLERSPGTQAPVAEIGSLARLPQCIVPAAPR
ncbi:MAG: HAD-IA family hydrolase [Gemmatimonadaceae bacterium]|nr:HAD-IA family hydrolase [Gemmatimonadaceae bacterium]